MYVMLCTTDFNLGQICTYKSSFSLVWGFMKCIVCGHIMRDRDRYVNVCVWTAMFHLDIYMYLCTNLLQGITLHMYKLDLP